MADKDVNAIAIIDTVNINRVGDMISKINQFQNVVQAHLKAGTDYGIIPGTKKPTLLKPGAEKILMLMGISSQYELIERVQDYEKGFFAFTVKCILSRNGYVITEGLGHCNSREKKYVSEKVDAYTTANTCLKVAKKRSQVDAVLTIASLSDVFTQDVEDMAIDGPEEPVREYAPNDAANVVITFGKYRGKTLGEIVATDRKYVQWLSEKANSADVRSAAMTVLRNDGSIDEGDTDESEGAR